jgi:hypothetical protein
VRYAFGRAPSSVIGMAGTVVLALSVDISAAGTVVFAASSSVTCAGRYRGVLGEAGWGVWGATWNRAVFCGAGGFRVAPQGFMFCFSLLPVYVVEP